MGFLAFFVALLDASGLGVRVVKIITSHRVHRSLNKMVTSLYVMLAICMKSEGYGLRSRTRLSCLKKGVFLLQEEHVLVSRKACSSM